MYAFVDRYSNSADKIYTAVNEMCDLFPTVRTACLLFELHVHVYGQVEVLPHINVSCVSCTHVQSRKACCCLKTVAKETIEQALNQLTMSADRLREQCSASRCEALHTSSSAAAGAEPKLHTQQVIQCAYDIAQAAKQLVMCFE